ncbi:MAG: TolC family protein [Saprospiraceae bacterium]|nr:TolC family protein [Saprospiraceae bacterium]
MRLFKVQIIFCIILSTLMPGILAAQVFQNYIEKAWQKNEALQAKTFDLKAAESSYLEAKAMYGPSVSFTTNYTLAAGGRNIAFPVGDLLNPVYNTLNNLTNSQQFGLLENQEINFFPNNFYDAKINVTQAIYYPDLALNKKLKRYETDLKLLEIKAFKRQLSKEVMISGFQLASANAVEKIYAEAAKLLSEAQRATQSMVNNDIAPIASLRRIEAQMADVEAQQIQANTMVKNALAYFVFLTGEPLDSNELATLPLLPSQTQTGVGTREELMQLAKGTEMTQLAIDKENNYYVPKVGAQLSLGSQDFNFGWQPYALFALNVDINLFDNKRHKYRTDATKAKMQEQQLKYNHAQSLLDLEVMTSENKCNAALSQVNTYAPRVRFAEQFYKDVYTRYKEGVAGYLELVDAQAQLTQSKLQFQLAKYNSWMQWSEWVYASAMLNIPQ